MKRDLLSPIRQALYFLGYPLIWAHEYCHYWVARRLGLLARIEGARTYVHRPNRWQHILIAIAPTIPSLLILAMAIAGYLRFATTPDARIDWGVQVGAAVLLLLSCALDWRSIIQSILNPNMLQADSSAILVVSKAGLEQKRLVQLGLEKMGYFVDWAASGEAVAHRLNQNPFDLIVIEPALPDLKRDLLANRQVLRQDAAAVPLLQLKSRDELSKLPEYLEVGIPQDRAPTA